MDHLFLEPKYATLERVPMHRKPQRKTFQRTENLEDLHMSGSIQAKLRSRGQLCPAKIIWEDGGTVGRPHPHPPTLEDLSPRPPH